MTESDEYKQTIEFLAGCFPTLAASPASSRRLYHDTFKRAVELRHGVIDDDFYDVAIATSVFADVLAAAIAELIGNEPPHA
jgi:hypothetical protein